jgi:adenine-specific DNA methylase
MINEMTKFQEKIFDSVCEKIDTLCIETNEKGWKAKYYLYCTETKCPECGYTVPLSSTWIISNDTHTITEFKENAGNKSFEIIVRNGV